MELNHGPFGLQPKALPLSYNTPNNTKKRKQNDKENNTLRENFTTKLQGLETLAPAANRTRAFPNLKRMTTLESAGIDPATCRMRIDRSTT